MRYSAAFGVTVLASIAGVAVADDIPRIKLQGLPAVGNYEDVASLDKDGNCARKTVTWSQSGSPLDEEVLPGRISLASTHHLLTSSTVVVDFPWPDATQTGCCVYPRGQQQEQA